MKIVIAIVLMAGLMFQVKLQFFGSSPTNSQQSVLYEQGKRIFAARCAKCHDEDANKKLPDGTTLVERLALSKNPEERLGTRLKDKQERHAVMIYMDPLIAQWRSSTGSRK